MPPFIRLSDNSFGNQWPLMSYRVTSATKGARDFEKSALGVSRVCLGIWTLDFERSVQENRGGRQVLGSYVEG